MSVVVSDLSFAYDGDDDLFFDVSFRIATGEHWAIVGENGCGKSTLMRILAGEYSAATGTVSIDGDFVYLAQDIGFASQDTLRDTLLKFAPPALRAAGTRLAEVERRLAAGDQQAGLEIGQAVTDWAELQGYQLEGRWDATVRRVLGVGLEGVLDRSTSTFSGGERKRIAIDLALSSSAGTVLLDEPDNYLDIPAKQWLEQRIRESEKTVLAISHDREFLTNVFGKILTLEGLGAWVHGGGYSTYADAREQRQARLGDALARWKDEETRLFQHMKIMKQRASVNPKNAPKANAAESRLERFRAAGPPPPPASTRRVKMRLRGGDAGRQALRLTALGIGELIHPFSDIVRHNERLGLIGPNGTGKSHILRALAGEVQHVGEVTFGARVTPGSFTQVNDRPEFLRRTAGEIVQARTGDFEGAMRALARYGLEQSFRNNYEALSGGQKARLEILCLELAGFNLLLLDEPTDNLDVGSAESLELALQGFEGACISVSHDRAYLREMDRYWLVDNGGDVYELLDWSEALAALGGSTDRGSARLLSEAGHDRFSRGSST